MLELRYFAWLRERLGTEREAVETDAATIGELVAELRAKSDRHAHVFADMSAIRAAVDQELVAMDAAIGGAREVAFFPPMTGG
ncbi:MAG: molybdopterin converting factor subunit 1 [Pseudomonadota bacterium]